MVPMVGGFVDMARSTLDFTPLLLQSQTIVMKAQTPEQEARVALVGSLLLPIVRFPPHAEPAQ
jgi:hypothetical protein